MPTVGAKGSDQGKTPNVSPPGSNMARVRIPSGCRSYLRSLTASGSSERVIRRLRPPLVSDLVVLVVWNRGASFAQIAALVILIILKDWNRPATVRRAPMGQKLRAINFLRAVVLCSRRLWFSIVSSAQQALPLHIRLRRYRACTVNGKDDDWCDFRSWPTAPDIAAQVNVSFQDDCGRANRVVNQFFHV